MENCKGKGHTKITLNCWLSYSITQILSVSCYKTKKKFFQIFFILKISSFFFQIKFFFFVVLVLKWKNYWCIKNFNKTFLITVSWSSSFGVFIRKKLRYIQCRQMFWLPQPIHSSMAKELNEQ